MEIIKKIICKLKNESSHFYIINNNKALIYESSIGYLVLLIELLVYYKVQPQLSNDTI